MAWPMLQLAATDALDAIAVGTTGYAVQSSGFSNPGYASYALSAFTDASGNETILDINPSGGFTYDNVLRGNFTKRGDTLVFDGAQYTSINDLYAAYPLGASYEFNFLYDSAVRTENGIRPSEPVDLPVNPGYLVSALSTDTNVAADGFWDNGKLILDVAGTYTLSFYQFALEPYFAEAIVRGDPEGIYYEILVDAYEANLGSLVINGADLVAGHNYDGAIEIFYGDAVTGSHDPTVDFMRSVTTFTIEAVPEPSSFALWAGFLVAMAFLVRPPRGTGL
jgi:hypothetical protein